MLASVSRLFCVLLLAAAFASLSAFGSCEALLTHPIEPLAVEAVQAWQAKLQGGAPGPLIHQTMTKMAAQIELVLNASETQARVSSRALAEMKSELATIHKSMRAGRFSDRSLNSLHALWTRAVGTLPYESLSGNLGPYWSNGEAENKTSWFRDIVSPYAPGSWMERISLLLPTFEDTSIEALNELSPYPVHVIGLGHPFERLKDATLDVIFDGQRFKLGHFLQRHDRAHARYAAMAFAYDANAETIAFDATRRGLDAVGRDAYMGTNPFPSWTSREPTVSYDDIYRTIAQREEFYLKFRDFRDQVPDEAARLGLNLWWFMAYHEGYGSNLAVYTPLGLKEFIVFFATSRGAERIAEKCANPRFFGADPRYLNLSQASIQKAYELLVDFLESQKGH